jgi:hypothetical protein
LDWIVPLVEMMRSQGEPIESRRLFHAEFMCKCEVSLMVI